MFQCSTMTMYREWYWDTNNLVLKLEMLLFYYRMLVNLYYIDQIIYILQHAHHILSENS